MKMYFGEQKLFRKCVMLGICTLTGNISFQTEHFAYMADACWKSWNIWMSGKYQNQVEPKKCLYYYQHNIRLFQMPVCVSVMFVIWHFCLCSLMERWLKEVIWLKKTILIFRLLVRISIKSIECFSQSKEGSRKYISGDGQWSSSGITVQLYYLKVSR